MAGNIKKKPSNVLKDMTEEHRRMVAEGLATMHRFAAEPSLKHNKPQYKGGGTVAALAHAKIRRGR